MRTHVKENKQNQKQKTKSTIKQNIENQLAPSMVAKKYVDAENALSAQIL